MLYFLLFISVVTETLKNIFSNDFSKTRLNTLADAVIFNIVCCIGAILIFLILGAGISISRYSFLLAVGFAVTTVGWLLFSLLAMASGPMSYSLLFTYLGMVIPTLFGIFCYNQNVSTTQIIGFVLMILTVYLGVDMKGDSKFSLKWFIYAIISFLMCGGLGIVQQMHQTSEYAHEINEFLLWGFIISMVFYGIIFIFTSKKDKKESMGLFKGKPLALGFVSGVFLGAVNFINLYLSGKLPSIIFFPIVNGGVLVLSSIAAIAVFKEKPDKRQMTGIIAGILAVCLLGL